MKILFISHGYPPTIGGIENQNYDLATGLGKITPVKVIANSRGKAFLPIFLPWAFLKAFFLMTRCDVCLLGSGVLAPIGRTLKFFHPRKKFFSVIHGLDITFASKEGFLAKIYARVNIPALKKLDRLFAIGNATIDEADKASIDRELFTFIPNGVDIDKVKESHTRKELGELFGKNIENKKVILRLGRFVPHKGTSWFIDKIMPRLPENVVMIAAGGRVGKNTAGDQDDFIGCEEAILNNQLQERVRLMPSIPWQEVKILLNTVDLVVSPNIKHPGSMEGFGLTTLEAGACERVVLASDLEGLADAIQNGKNGFLVEPENVEVWTKKVMKILDAGEGFARAFGKRAHQYVEENSTWEKICRRYFEEMKKYL